MNFRELHDQEEPLLLCNVWDVTSAKIAEALGFQAIGTSSAAIASTLGYQDGEEISFTKLERIVASIRRSTNLPLTVDIESGYSEDPMKVAEHIKRLHDLDVVGINIEDSVVKEKRRLKDARIFSQFLLTIVDQLKRDQIDIFINVRTDPFLIGHHNPLAETIARAKAYEASGADGIFVPCIEKAYDIAQVVQGTDLPINVICMPDLPDFNKLKTLGVKRISMGNFLFDRMYNDFQNSLIALKTQGSFSPVFKTVQTGS